MEDRQLNDDASGFALPPALTGPRVWYGPAMAAAPEAWSRQLEAEEIAEIAAAAEAVMAQDLDLGRLTAADFPLPKTADRLAALRRELIAGRGFALLRGLPVEAWSRRKVACAFLGLGAHLGSLRSQNAKGHLLGHVCDLEMTSADPSVRIYQTRERQTFHTDSCDVVALVCLRQAQRGGGSLLVSAETLFNEMRRRRPDLLRRLFAPIATDRRGEVPPGAKPYFLIPVFTWHEGSLTVMYQRQYIDSAQAFAEAPRLDRETLAALDLFDEIANDPSLHLRMRLTPGDLQFVYNHALLHDREAFEDWPEPANRRHLLRLWISVPGDRALAPVFAERFGALDPGARGGIVTEGTRLHAPLEPA
jgi:hypothetical protein